MALILTNNQTNDGITLYLSDESIWGSDGLPAFADVTNVALTIAYETPTETVAAMTYTNALTIFQAAQTAVDESLVVYPITMLSLGIGAAGAPLPDGIWTVTYSVTSGAGTVVMDPISLLLDALIKTEVYKKVGAIQYSYYANNNFYTKPIDDTLLIQSLYDSMLANAYVAKQEEILKILEVLQRQTT